ncbi:Protein kinase of the Mitotic Exit Network, partial [Kickxella alabastrina]
MSVKQASSTHYGDFQPEELLGQLKAEQQTRNYDTAIKFIEAVLGLQLEASTLKDSLRDGVVLCRLINTLRPGAIKRINTRSLPFTQMENIGNFLSAAQKLGLESTDLFQTVDLYEGKNIPRVIMTLLTIARVVAGIPLNSHRKLGDAQRTLGDGWNSSTLTVWANSPSPKSLACEYTSLHNQPTLVNTSKVMGNIPVFPKGELLTATAVLLGRPPGSPRVKPVYGSRKERRRSKRQSAATLFIPSPAEKVRSPTTNTPLSAATATAAVAKAQPVHSESLQDELKNPQIENTAARQDILKLAPAPVVFESNTRNTAPDSSSQGLEPDMQDNAAKASAASNTVLSASSKDTQRTASSSGSSRPDKSPIGSENEHEDAIPVPRPRKRTNTKNRPKERLTVYSENDQRLTNYQLGNCIGRGQFGSVYRALDLETGQMVAVKQIALVGQDVDDMDDVMQEVDLLKSLSSPRIVRYYGFVKTDAHLNLVMEFVENGSLSATLKSFGSFPEKLVLAYAIKIIEGLVYLHGRDVVHCDLKACNILTTKKGNTKLTDFGVSLNLKLRKPGDESVVAGTPYWMAPEIIQLDGACMASDIWSLGCTIIELLTGKPPYSDLMQMAALYRIVEDDHPPIPEGISQELKDFLLQCFRKEPSERPTAAELMSHSWAAQYGRNRKELKMLRRTCSRKMSSFMARTVPSEQSEYPTFDVARLNTKPLSPLDEGGGSDAAEEDIEKEDTAVLPDSADTLCRFDGSGLDAAALSATLAPLSLSPAAGAFVGHTLLSSAAASPTSACGNETDGSISTFEGPRMKRHRLHTILCDNNSVCVCAVCSRALSGAFIQCSSCKTRCHDACTRQLAPCSAMRMSRFLYPASRKSSKRYESKTPNLRLRAHRKSTARSQTSQTGQSPQVSHVSASMADLIGGTCGSVMGSIIGSSDGSLYMGARSSLLRDGFDGVIGEAHTGRPVSLAVTMGLSAAIAQAEEQTQDYLHGLPQPRSVGRQCGRETAESGWETDDTAEAVSARGVPPPIERASYSTPPVMRQSFSAQSQQQQQHQQQQQPQQYGSSKAPLHPNMVSIQIPESRHNKGPFSAPLTSRSSSGTPAYSQSVQHQ